LKEHGGSSKEEDNFSTFMAYALPLNDVSIISQSTILGVQFLPL
jgi:hypothetical protein